MAKQIARLLRTDMMADMTLPALAQLLQKKGRGKDKILAHITPNEARRLKKDGGSGTINPDTGLFEFEDDGAGSYDAAPAEVASAPAAESAAQPVTDVPAPAAAENYFAQAPDQGGVLAAPQAQSMTGPESFYAYNQGAGKGVGFEGSPTGPAFPDYSPTSGLQMTTVPTEKPAEGMSDKTKDMLLKGALGLGTGLAGAYAGRKSAQQAQAAKGEMAAIGSPYQQKGQELQAAALRGELTPAGQQQVQAARAQLAQGIERRGGVGAAQAATQLAGFKQQLLDTQYNYGLKVAQIGDSYAANAIRLGLTQDKEMAALMGGLTSAAGAFIGGQPNVPVK